MQSSARNSQSLLRTASDTRQAGITPKIIRRLSIAELTGSLPSGNVGKEGLEEFGRALYSQLIAPVPEKGIAELFDLDPMSGRPSRSIVSLSEIAFDAEQARRQRKLLGEEGELEEGLRFPERKPKEMEY